MSDRNELFPFPEPKDSKKNSDLPSFPSDNANEEPPLSSKERKQVRNLIAKFAEEKPEPKPALDHEIPVFSPENFVPQETKTTDSRTELLAYWQQLQATEQYETEIRDTLKKILENVADQKLFVRIFASLTAIFPLKRNLRHGTPDQKLFTLIALGDRFLQGIAGVFIPDRKLLIKTVAKYLSEVSENYSFIQMETENFSPQYHERVQGSANGSKIREMHGFLVVAKQTNQVVRLGAVLT